MQIDDAPRIVIKQRHGDDLPEVRKECPVRAHGRDPFNFSGFPHVRNRFNPQTGAARPRINGGWRERATAARGAW